MNFKREQTKDYYLLNTEIENIFVNEYMASAPGDYVKVYLFALMYADLGHEMTNEDIARHLGLKEEDILKAWSYWESQGVIKKKNKTPEHKFNYEVAFVNLKELLYGKAEKKKKQAVEENTKRIMADKDVKKMYNSIERITGKVISGAEMMEILSWMNDLSATPEVIIYAYSYCKEKNKKNIRYVAAVVKGWVTQGLTDAGAVEEYLANTDQRHYLYRRVCKALGFARNATEAEERIMDSWFDEMGFAIDKVLLACGKTSGISNPNINYVNKILTNWHNEQTGKSSGGGGKTPSSALVRKYYEHLRRTAEQEAERRRQQVYKEVPRIKEIEAEMSVCGRDISKAIISDKIDKENEVKRLRNKSDSLNRERAVLLTENDLEITHLDVRYKCSICKDTGTNDKGERCECFSLRTKEAELWQ